jgi:hypothetical protein
MCHCFVAAAACKKIVNEAESKVRKIFSEIMCFLTCPVSREVKRAFMLSDRKSCHSHDGMIMEYFFANITIMNFNRIICTM